MTEEELQTTQFFQELVAAKSEFDDACHGLQRAQERRNSAATVLRQLTDRAEKLLQMNLEDPTQAKLLQNAIPPPAQIGNQQIGVPNAVPGGLRRR